MSESDAQFFVREHDGWTFAFDRKSLQRGLDYAEEGRSEIVSILDMTVRAQCAGSGGRTYYQRITLDMTEDGLECRGTCSCPVGEDCKHCAAALYLLERGPGLVGFTSGSPKHQHALAAVVIEAAFLGQGEQAFLAVPHQLVTLHVMRHLARAMPGLQPAPQPTPLAESGQARELEPVRGRRPGHAKASLGLTPGSCPAWRDQSAACKAGLFCNGASALEHMDLMAIQRQFVGGGRSHHARSNHGDLQDATPTGA